MGMDRTTIGALGVCGTIARVCDKLIRREKPEFLSKLLDKEGTTNVDIVIHRLYESRNLEIQRSNSLKDLLQVIMKTERCSEQWRDQLA